MKHSKSALFLMELIVAIMFFALASAICMQLFVKAKMINSQSIHQEQAMRISSTVIESYKNNQEITNKLYFDENGQKTSQTDVYTVKNTIIENTLTVTVYYQSEKIYKISYYHYIQRTMR